MGGKRGVTHLSVPIPYVLMRRVGQMGPDYFADRVINITNKILTEQKIYEMYEVLKEWGISGIRVDVEVSKEYGQVLLKQSESLNLKFLEVLAASAIVAAQQG